MPQDTSPSPAVLVLTHDFAGNSGSRFAASRVGDPLAPVGGFSRPSVFAARVAGSREHFAGEAAR